MTAPTIEDTDVPVRLRSREAFAEEWAAVQRLYPDVFGGGYVGGSE